MAPVTVYLNIYESGHVVGDLLVEITPRYDQAVNWMQPLLASDACFVGKDEKRHPFSDERKAHIMARIEDECPAEWREIEDAADAETVEECAEWPHEHGQFGVGA